MGIVAFPVQCRLLLSTPFLKKYLKILLKHFTNHFQNFLKIFLKYFTNVFKNFLK